METQHVIIIGAGPGGLSTALQLKRYGILPLIFEKDQVGGLLNNANLVENYPGFPKGIPGPALVKLFIDQLQNHSIPIVNEKVEVLQFRKENFQVRTDRQEYQSNILVIASGTKPRRFTDIKIPKEIQGQVFYQVYPLLHLSGKRIAIVGAGDAAFDYALNLARGNEIEILNRGEQVSCLPLLWERAKQSPRIHYHPGTKISTLHPTIDRSISLECQTPAGQVVFEVDSLVGAIGREPQLDFISGQFSKKAIQLENSGDLYYVGDVINGLYRQTAIAVGNGILTAMKIYNHLQESNL